MATYTYKTVPAPERARKIKGVKTPEARFAATLEEDMNALAAEGWEFLRTETFEVEERTGLAGKKSVERQVMVYRKRLDPPASTATEAAPSRPEPVLTAAPTDPPQGPRILGRPVPPVTRFPRDAEQPRDAE